MECRVATTFRVRFTPGSGGGIARAASNGGEPKTMSPFHFCWLGEVWKSLASKCVTEISASRPPLLRPPFRHPSGNGPLEPVMPRNDPLARSFFPPLFIPCRGDGGLWLRPQLHDSGQVCSLAMLPQG